MSDSMFCEHGAPRGGSCKMCEEGVESVKLTPEMEEATHRVLYHHPYGGRTILELLTKREFPTELPTPTEEQKQMAHDFVEELLRIHYRVLNDVMQEVTGESLEDNPYI